MAGITVNKNTVPKEKRSPMVTSGIRVGTPAVTTRGMGVEESKWIADRIADVIEDHTNESKVNQIKKRFTTFVIDSRFIRTINCESLEHHALLG